MEPQCWGSRGRRILGAHWLASPAYLSSPGARKRLCTAEVDSVSEDDIQGCPLASSAVCPHRIKIWGVIIGRERWRHRTQVIQGQRSDRNLKPAKGHAFLFPSHVFFFSFLFLTFNNLFTFILFAMVFACRCVYMRVSDLGVIDAGEPPCGH